MKRLILLSIFFALIIPVFTVGSTQSLIEKNQLYRDTIHHVELNIYPNPTETGRVTLETATGEIAEIRLVNIAGKEIITRNLEYGTSKYILSLIDVPNGIYFIRVHTTDNKMVVKKLVVSGR